MPSSAAEMSLHYIKLESNSANCQAFYVAVGLSPLVEASS